MKLRVLGALLLLMGAITAATSPPVGAAALLTVTPATGLIDLQTVRVEATGFSSGVRIGACQTVPDADSDSDCALGTLVITNSSVATGAVSLTITVRRFAYIPSLGRTVDCADPAERCTVAAAEAMRIATTIVEQPIAFAPPPPPPPTRGSVVVSPDDGLVHRDVVTVEGRGFRPDVDIVVAQCAHEPVTPIDCRPDPTVARTDDAGAFSASLTVTQLFYRPLGAPIVDCAASACAVAVSERLDFPGTVVVTPIGFAPPSGEPAISVTPDEDLRPGDVVTVTGVGFVPNESVDVWQCRARGCGQQVVPVVGRDGSFSIAFPLVDPGDDCRTAAASCSVRVQQLQPWFITLDAPIAFAPPDPPPPLPPVAVPGGATVVEGDGTTTELRVPVTLSAPTDQTVTVEWETVYDPAWSEVAAVPGLDHAPGSGVLTFAPGQTEAAATIAVTGDETPEVDELLVISFHDPTNARMGGFWGLGFGGITDDD